MKGLGTALITPFTPFGEVDYKALTRLIEKQIEGGVDYLVVLGTTAETATLSHSEQLLVQQHIVRVVDKRVPLVLGLGGNNTAAVVEQLHNFARQKIRFAYSAILSVCPYYNKPSQEGIYQHFSAIAQASPIPVILYNVPSRTGTNMQPETVLRLAVTFPNKIVGIKEASGDVEQIKFIIENAPKGFDVISGDDNLAAELMDAGAVGLISVASNAWPKTMHQIVHQHDHTLQRRFNPIIKLLFKEGNPAGIKTVLSEQGMIENVLRLPLVPNSLSVQEQIRQTIAQMSTT